MHISGMDIDASNLIPTTIEVSTNLNLVILGVPSWIKLVAPLLIKRYVTPNWHALPDHDTQRSPELPT